MEEQERAGSNRAYRVSEAQLEGIERAMREADRATDQAYSRIMRERSDSLRELLAAARDLATYQPPSWLVAELTDMVERECQWLADVAFKVAPTEGSS